MAAYPPRHRNAAGAGTWSAALDSPISSFLHNRSVPQRKPTTNSYRVILYRRLLWVSPPGSYHPTSASLRPTHRRHNYREGVRLGFLGLVARQLTVIRLGIASRAFLSVSVRTPSSIFAVICC